VASKVDFTHPQFKPGVSVHHWNGIPIARAVEMNAELNAGSNPDARHARGLEAMTLRPMDTSLPPDEEWVILEFERNGANNEIRLPWQVYEQSAVDGAALAQPGGTTNARRIGMDFQTERVRRAKVTLFFPAVAEKRFQLNAAREAGLAPSGDDSANPLPDILKCRVVDTPSGKFGYLRIYSFAPPFEGGPDNFLDQFFSTVISMLGQLPQTGLIVDVRGNGGGIIEAGERLLQLFTPNRITPERFDFINTPVTRQITSNSDDLKPWAASVAQAVETGSAYSQAFPLTPEDEANDVGQLYQGPLVLITDALIYSTTDMFSAGFRDHNIGPILGTAGNVGAGGANVWNYKDLRDSLPDVFKPLPKGTDMRVAIRRSTRVGAMVGMPLEELGVKLDAIHQMTENDVFNDNADLIARAAKLFEGRKVRRLAGAVDVSQGSRHLKLSTKNLTRVDVYLNGRPALSLDVKDGDTATDLKVAAGSGRIYLEGYDGDEFAVTFNLPVQ